ncbi:MAG: dihydroorotase [Halanaerobiales bacterium]
MKILLKNALVIDPKNKLNGYYDLLIKDAYIKSIKKNIKENNKDTVYDLKGKIIIPGLIDMHTHLREPGYEEKETIKTGCEAAAAGGFTTIACMPNTSPVVDNPATVEYIKSKAKNCLIKVVPIGSITKESEGKELAEIGFLASAGVCALSDDGRPVMNGEVMRRAMEYSSSFNLPIISHCEDLNLAGDGVMNEGYNSTILGLKPIPAAAEEVMIARDIILAELTDCQLHIAHLSTKRGVDLVADAKKRGINISAEVTPHHLTLSDDAVRGYNPDTKVNPPLRSREDVEALRKGLGEGIIDVIATDHAPHTFEDKLGEYDYASFGISGLETALSLSYDKLIKNDILDWNQIVTAMTVNPAGILGLDFKGIKQGAKADITIFDPDRKWTVEKNKLKSKGKNTPFAGSKLEGKVILTIINGNVIYNDLNGNGELIYE